jgi:hypothetical protein
LDVRLIKFKLPLCEVSPWERHLGALFATVTCPATESEGTSLAKITLDKNQLQVDGEEYKLPPGHGNLAEPQGDRCMARCDTRSVSPRRSDSDHRGYLRGRNDKDRVILRLPLRGASVRFEWQDETRHVGRVLVGCDSEPRLVRPKTFKGGDRSNANRARLAETALFCFLGVETKPFRHRARTSLASSYSSSSFLKWLVVA